MALRGDHLREFADTVVCAESALSPCGLQEELAQQVGLLQGRLWAARLRAHPDPEACRPARVFLQRDRNAGQWLLCNPGGGAVMSNADFADAMAEWLCLPVPSCARLVGAAVGATSYVVDAHGDGVMSARLPGDGWRAVHDAYKLELASLCRWAALEVDAEVVDLFSADLPQDRFVQWSEATVAKEKGPATAEAAVRRRQGMVPDLRLRVAGRETLAEVKTINCCVSRYGSPRTRKAGYSAVGARAAEVAGEYRRKARRLDQELLGVAAGAVGPVQARLESYGEVVPVVFGAFGEVSAGVRRLVDMIVERRLVRVAGTTDREAKGERSVIVSYVRRRLSLVGARARAQERRKRLAWVGDEAAGLLRRRGLVARDVAERDAELAAERDQRGAGRYFAGFGKAGPRRW